MMAQYWNTAVLIFWSVILEILIFSCPEKHRKMTNRDPWNSVYTGMFKFTEKVRTTYNEKCGFIQGELNKYLNKLLVNVCICVRCE